MLLLVIAPLISQLQTADHVVHPPSPFQSDGTRPLQLSLHSSDSEHSGHTHKSSSEHDERDVAATDRDARGGSPVHVAAPSGSHADHDPLTHALEACGYCFLLANSLALGDPLNAAFAFPSATGQFGERQPASQAPRTAPYVPHRPRGPPLNRSS